MKTLRVISFVVIIISISSFIGWTFWTQEIRYSLPTPVPAHLINIRIGDNIDLKNDLRISQGKPALLHFFNPDCPCSRFNMQEFESLAHRHKSDLQVYIIIQSNSEEAVTHFKKKYELDIPVLLDQDGSISHKCGIYSTPQAVLLDKNSNIYFKGNYNASRYCTRKETKFVEMAIDSLMMDKPLPLFVQNMLTAPYGCPLPSDDENQKDKIAFTLF